RERLVLRFVFLVGLWTRTAEAGSDARLRKLAGLQSPGQASLPRRPPLTAGLPPPPRRARTGASLAWPPQGGADPPERPPRAARRPSRLTWATAARNLSAD